MQYKFILGKKGHTNQMFTDAGERIPATSINVSSCYVVDVRTKDTHGYWAIVIGLMDGKKNNKPEEGFIKKAGISAPLRFLREIRLDNNSTEKVISLIEKDGKAGIKINDKEFNIGDQLKTSEIFTKDDMISVTAVAKGKGFQGVVRRHGFAGGPRTHGQSDRERAPGSIGTGTTPGRVYKGKRMAGRMGGGNSTVKNLRVVQVNENELIVKGLIPGSKGNLVIVNS